MPHRILLADDHDASRRAMAALLENSGFIIEMAEDGSDALRLLMGAGFDLTLMDVHMPCLTGVEVLYQLKANGLAVPSILMTGRPSPAIEMAAMEAGALTMLRKPIAAEVLRWTVEQVLRGQFGPLGPGNPPHSS